MFAVVIGVVVVVVIVAVPGEVVFVVDVVAPDNVVLADVVGVVEMFADKSHVFGSMLR